MPTKLIASLPMYDWPEIQSETDQLWRHLATAWSDEPVEPPLALSREDPDSAHWLQPNLLLSQTCGFPYVSFLQDKVSLLVTPAYAVQGCRGSDYSSQLLARRDDTRQTLTDFSGAVPVMNDAGSQSGCNSLRLALQEAGVSGRFFGPGLFSGGHRNSIVQVANGDGDICAIDPISFELAKRYEPDAVSALKLVGQTPYTPGLPYICAVGLSDTVDIERVRQRLQTQLDSLPSNLRDSLFINGSTRYQAADYHVIRQLSDQAAARGLQQFYTE